jgi:hypothetical protein
VFWISFLGIRDSCEFAILNYEFFFSGSNPLASFPHLLFLSIARKLPDMPILATEGCRGSGGWPIFRPLKDARRHHESFIDACKPVGHQSDMWSGRISEGERRPDVLRLVQELVPERLPVQTDAEVSRAFLFWPL